MGICTVVREDIKMSVLYWVELRAAVITGSALAAGANAIYMPDEWIFHCETITIYR